MKTTGDGVLAVFDSSERAVRAAAAICLAARGIGLAIRAGVHTGEVELAAGDVRGMAVHVAARVMALAGPSQVYVSATTRELVADSGLTFVDAGAHELKGVPGRGSSTAWASRRLADGPLGRPPAAAVAEIGAVRRWEAGLAPAQRAAGASTDRSCPDA